MADLTALPAPLLYLAMMRSSFGATTSHGAESVSSAFAVDQCNLAAGECVASIPILGGAPRAVEFAKRRNARRSWRQPAS
jgi:hypothetical protein